MGFKQLCRELVRTYLKSSMKSGRHAFGLLMVRMDFEITGPPISRRPFKQMNSLDLDGRMSVRIINGGRLALVKESGEETLLGIKPARAVMRAQLSGSNRYLYTVDCQAKTTLFDLWMKKQVPVAEIKTGWEGRSIAPSAIDGTEQLSLLVAANWPPQYVVLDGRIPEPHILHKFQDFGDVRVGCIGDD